MNGHRGNYTGAVIPAAAIAYLVIMFLAGQPPGHGNRVVSEIAGLLTLDPTSIVRVEVLADAHTHTFVRRPDGWYTAGDDDGEPVGPLIDTALGLLHRAAPIRVLTPEQTAGVAPGVYGLAPPALEIRLSTTTAGETFGAAFGAAVNDGRARYVRVQGRAETSIVSGFVYDAWGALVH